MELNGIEIGIMGLIALLSAIALGVDAVLALAVSGLVGLVAVTGIGAASPSYEAIFGEMARHFSVSIVFFLLMGQLALRGGLAEELLGATSAWFGGFHAGLAFSTTLATGVLGPGSGSSAATDATVARLALPAMIARGYDRRLAAASVAMGGLLSMLLPPGSLLVIYGILTGTNVAGLIVSGILPALLLAAIFCLTTVLLVRRKPDLAPVSAHPALRDRLRTLRIAAPLALLAVFVMVGLGLGLLSPLAAGAIGAGGMGLLAVIARLIRPKGGHAAAAVEVARQTGYALATVVAALVFDRFLTLSGVPSVVQGALASFQADQWLVVGMVAAAYLLLGAMIEPAVLMSVMLPVTLPIVVHLGYDPVWFGVFTVLLIETGAILPPVGRNCGLIPIASGGAVRFEDVINGLPPHIVAAFAVTGLLCLFPALALFLPQRIF